MSGIACTYHRLYGPKCGRPEDDPVHARKGERMRPGAHVFRVELTREEARKAAQGVAPTEQPSGDIVGSVRAWVRSRSETEWAPSWSKDFRDGYDTAVSEVAALVGPVLVLIARASHEHEWFTGTLDPDPEATICLHCGAVQ